MGAGVEYTGPLLAGLCGPAAHQALMRSPERRAALTTHRAWQWHGDLLLGEWRTCGCCGRPLFLPVAPRRRA